MKKRFYLLFIMLVAIEVKGQILQHLSYSTTFGTGISINEPSRTPISWQIMGNYYLSKHFSTGIGAGISGYEKVLVPVFAHVMFRVIRPHTWTPYLDCSVGYAFAPDKKANGGFYINSAIGVQYIFSKKIKLLFAVGYE